MKILLFNAKYTSMSNKFCKINKVLIHNDVSIVCSLKSWILGNNIIEKSSLMFGSAKFSNAVLRWAKMHIYTHPPLIHFIDYSSRWSCTASPLAFHL